MLLYWGVKVSFQNTSLISTGHAQWSKVRTDPKHMDDTETESPSPSPWGQRRQAGSGRFLEGRESGLKEAVKGSVPFKSE